MKCPNCQAENPDGSILCNNCGSELDQYEALTLDPEPTPGHPPAASQFKTPKYIDLRNVRNDVDDLRDLTSPNFVPPNQANINSNQPNIETLFAVNEEEKTQQEPIAQPEENLETSYVNKPLKIVTWLGLILVTLAIGFFFINRLPQMKLFNLAAMNLTDNFGTYETNKMIVVSIYLAIIFLLGYDAYRSRQSTIAKEASKNVIASLILTIISVIIFDHITNLKDTSIYVNAIIRFIFIVLISFANVYFRNSYNHLEQKCGIENIFFEIFIYFDTLTLVLLIFS